MKEKSNRGFAAMTPEARILIASKGGRAGSEGKGWHGDSKGHAQAGRKGGQK